MKAREPLVAIIDPPSEPAERAAWGKQMVRFQLAMWIDEGAECAVCKRRYVSVEDMLERNPKAGGGFQSGDAADRFVDDACFGQYKAGK